MSHRSIRKRGWQDTIEGIGNTASGFVLFATLVTGMLLMPRSVLRSALGWMIHTLGFGPSIVILALTIPMLVVVVASGIVAIAKGVIAADRTWRFHRLRWWPEGVAEVIAVRPLDLVDRDATTTSARASSDVDLLILAADGTEALVRVRWSAPDAIAIGTRFPVHHRPGKPHDLLWLP